MRRLHELIRATLRRTGFGSSGCALLLLVSPLLATSISWAADPVAGHLPSDTVWSGSVRVGDDLLIPPGVTLTVRPGTRVEFDPALSTKTDPAFWQAGTEIAVGGRLEILGTPAEPVILGGDAPWGGLVAAPGSRVTLRHAVLRDADEGLLCVGATCELDSVVIQGGEVGVVVGPGTQFRANAVRVAGTRVGVYDARPVPAEPLGIEIQGSRDAARLRLAAPPVAVSPRLLPGAGGPGVEYLGEYTVVADETWQGGYVLAGRVTVVPGAVLTLAPGTTVRFRKVDSNGDGLGEGELLVLGGIRSLGTPARPVVFESAETEPHPGDWDKVSLISSEDPDNRFEYTAFRHGVQALHAHFSSFRADTCLFQSNLRAVQFQESDLAVITGSVFVENKQALRFRDSTATLVDNRFVDNLYGVHAFRADLEFAGNVLSGSRLGGFLAKESHVRFLDNRVTDSRDGARMKDPDSTAEIRGNLIRGMAEDALSLSAVVGVVEGNWLEDAGLDLVGLEDSAVRVEGNSLLGSGRHALHLKGATDVSAPGNYWGEVAPEARIWDAMDDPRLGRVVWEPAALEPRRSMRQTEGSE